MELQGQAQTFLVTVLTGALLGIMFDFYRVLRGLFRPQAVVTALADFLYWAVATCVVLVSLLMCNWLELRLYVFLGLAGGAAAYYRLLSRYAVYGLIRLLRLVGWVMNWLQRIVAYTAIKPLFFILRLLAWPFVKVRRPVGKFWRKMAAKWRQPPEPPPM